MGLSYVQTGGNTETQTVGIDLRGRHERAPWNGEVRGSLLRTESLDVLTSKKWAALLRGTRAVGDRVSVFAQTTFLRDVFSGIEREHAFDSGVLFKVVEGDRHTLSLTTAAAVTLEQREAAEDRTFLGGRAGAVYRLKVGAASELVVEADYLRSFAEAGASRARSLVSVTSALTRLFALKVSHQLAWVQEPVPGKENADTELVASIVARWPPS